jgi:hypothetical protein
MGYNNVYEYNCFGPNKNGVVAWGLSTPKTYATWETAYGKSTHSVEADPLFVDAANGDFHLRPGSPAINAGTNVGLTKDYNGNPIVGAPDIGAFEYQ